MNEACLTPAFVHITASLLSGTPDSIQHNADGHFKKWKQSSHCTRENFSILWQKQGIAHFTQKCRKCITGDHEKDTHLQYTSKGWNRKARHQKRNCLIRPQQGTSKPGDSYYSPLCMHLPVNDGENATSSDFGITNRFCQWGKFAIWNLRNMRINCTSL